MTEYEVSDEARNARETALGAIKSMEQAVEDYSPTDRHIPVQDHPNMDYRWTENAETIVENLSEAADATPGEDADYFSKHKVLDEYIDILQDAADRMGDEDEDLLMKQGFVDKAREAYQVLKDMQDDMDNPRLAKRED